MVAWDRLPAASLQAAWGVAGRVCLLLAALFAGLPFVLEPFWGFLAARANMTPMSSAGSAGAVGNALVFLTLTFALAFCVAGLVALGASRSYGRESGASPRRTAVKGDALR